MLFQFQSVTFSLLPKASKLVLQHSVEKVYAMFSARMVSTANPALQLDRFRFFKEKKTMSPEDIADVCSGRTSEECVSKRSKEQKDSLMSSTGHQ